MSHTRARSRVRSTHSASSGRSAERARYGSSTPSIPNGRRCFYSGATRAKKGGSTREEVADAERFAERAILEMNLRELRRAAGKTQEQVARVAKMKQSELSRAERREDHLLSTLRRYVEGVGGELEVVARVGGKMVKSRGV